MDEQPNEDEPTLAEDAPHPGASMAPDEDTTSVRGAVDAGTDGVRRDPDHDDDERTDRPDPSLEAEGASAGADPQPGQGDDTSADASV